MKSTGLQARIILFLGLSISSVSAYTYRSAPGCTKGSNNDIWLLDDEGECHKVNTKGPCGTNMLFFPHPQRSNTTHGFCDCFDARMETDEEIDFINNRELSACVKDVRSQIYVPERDMCFSAFDQGPCPSGKWLVLNDTFYPVCAKNQCPSKTGNPDPLSARYQFSHFAEDKCYQSMTRGYCPKNYKLRFSPNDWLPKCRYTSQSKKPCPQKPQSQTVLRSVCKPGSRRDYLSKCSRSVSPR